MFVGGTLIRRFDGFRRLMLHTAVEYQRPLTFSTGDLLVANRTLAALGGPPAPAEVKGELSPDGLPLLLLFLLTQDFPCQIGLQGKAKESMTRLGRMIHLFSFAAASLSESKMPLVFQEVVQELGESGASLHPVMNYDDNGEPVSCARAGAVARLGVGAEHGPYTLVVLLGEGAPPAPLEAKGTLSPAILMLKE